MPQPKIPQTKKKVDEYKNTRRLAGMLIQQYPERFPNATPDKVVDMLQKIATVETWDKNIVQKGGGPGRGNFQIENTSAPVAYQRYQNYQKILAGKDKKPLPNIKLKVVEDAIKVDGVPTDTANVMGLTKDQQAMLALSNISGAARAKKGIIDVTQPKNVWTTYHWAGSEDKLKERQKQWNDVMKSFEPSPKPVPKAVSTPQKKSPITKSSTFTTPVVPVKQSVPKVTSTPVNKVNLSKPTVERITMPDGSKMIKSDYEKRYGKKVMEKDLAPKYAQGGWVYPTNTAFPIYAQGGSVTFSTGGEKHKVYIKESPTGMGKGVEGHVMVNHPTMDKGKWDTIDLTKKAGAKTVAQGVAATKKWHRENPEYGMGGWTGYPDHTMYSSGMERFDRVRDYTKYADGGNIEPYNISDPAEFKRANRAYQDSLRLYKLGLDTRAINTDPSLLVPKNKIAPKNNYEQSRLNEAIRLLADEPDYGTWSPQQAAKLSLKSGIKPIGDYYGFKFVPNEESPVLDSHLNIYPAYQKPVRKPVYTPKPEYNITQYSEPMGPPNMEIPKEETIMMPSGSKMKRADFEKQYGSKVTQREFQKKAKGGQVTWQIID